MYYNLPTKMKTFTTNTTRPPSSPWQLAVVVAFERVASLSKGPNLPFRIIFGRCFFVILFFGELSPAGGRREVLSGGAAFSLFWGSGAFSPAPFGWRGRSPFFCEVSEVKELKK